MIEPTVPISRAVAVAAWGLSAVFILAGWVAFFGDHAGLGLMLTLSSMPFMAAAALLMIRCWASRVCNVVRVTSGVIPDDPGVVQFR